MQNRRNDYAVDGTLRAVAFDIDRLEVSGGPVVVYEDVSTKSSGAANFGLSDEGTLVYVSGGTTALARSLVWVEPGTGRAEPLPLDPQEYGGPRLSPDGGDVAVSVTRSGTRGLYVYRVSNGREHPLVTDGFVSAAVWTPNGELLVYRGGDGLYRVAADGSAEPERLLSGFNDTLSSVTPDGVLFFTRVVNGVAHRETWQIPLEGERTPTPVLFGELRQEAAHVSPLGDWMAFRSNETGQMEIRLKLYLRSGGTETVSIGGAISFTWSSDGSQIFYRVGTSMMAVSINADGPVGEPRELFPAPYFVDPTGGRHFDVDQNGRFLMMQEFRPELILVQNWFDELQRLVATP